MSLSNAKVLVTGATGFIGSRLIQWLVEVEKVKVVALVHQFKNASRISRFPIEMIQGDVTDFSNLMMAIRGCTHVVHAAVTFSGTVKQNRATTVEGARNVCEAAHRAGINRVIYLSTIDVHGNTPSGVIDENTPCFPASAYGQDKLDAENVIREYALKGLKSIILRLPVVYGPWSFWSTYPMQQFRNGCIVLPDEGAGICNALYVDDAVQCIMCALKAETKNNLITCLVSGPDKIAWKNFYEEHGKAQSSSDTAAIRFLPKSVILAQYSTKPNVFRRFWDLRSEWRIVLRLPGARFLLGILKKGYRMLSKRMKSASSVVVSTPPLPDVLPNPAHLELMASQSLIENCAAEKLIGFRPAISFHVGMEKTRLWLVWAGLNK